MSAGADSVEGTAPAPVRVRRAAAADLDEVERLAGDFAAETGWPRRPIDAAVRAALSGGTAALRLFVAERPDGALAGFAAACPAEDLLDGHGSFLSDIYVAPASRRSGVGRALVRAVADDVRAGGGSWILWNVGSDAPAAQAFYAALGAALRKDLAVMSMRL